MTLRQKNEQPLTGRGPMGRLLAYSALIVVVTSSVGCAVTQYYVFDEKDERPEGVAEARTMLRSSRYRPPAQLVDLSDMLWAVNQASGIAIQYEGIWHPEYNKHYEFTDSPGMTCRDALCVVWVAYELRAEFRAGRILLVQERGRPIGPVPKLLE